jgi:uncharacterized protein YndB with AHSA1/START domain
MGTDSIVVTAVIPASAASVYAAWLDSEGHSAMTGSEAVIDPVVGGAHSSWSGYISGETRALEAGRRIEQTWRALDFPEGSAHSMVVVTIEDEGEGARVTVTHSDLPQGMGAGFEIGWQQFYFTPMMAYFETGGAEAPKRRAPAKKAVVKKSPAKKPAAKKAVAKKAVAKKAVAKKAVAKKAVGKKPAAKKAVAKKSPAKKPAAKKAVAKKAVAKKPAAKKSPAKKPAAKKAVAKKAAKKRS